MLVGEITKTKNVFIVELKSDRNSVTGNIAQVVTTKIKSHSIGAIHLKADINYNEEDAEVWVFNCGTASDYI